MRRREFHVFMAAQLSKWQEKAISFSYDVPNLITVDGRLLSRASDMFLDNGIAIVFKIEPDITNSFCFLEPSSFLLIQAGVLSTFRLLPDAELLCC